MRHSRVSVYAVLVCFALTACSLESAGVQCAAGADCLGGVCGLDGFCAPKSGCVPGASCPGGICDLDGRCIPKLSCTGPQDCPSLDCLPNGECAAIVCGDAEVQGSEECDDGDADDGDGCSSSCRREWVPIADSVEPVRVSGSLPGCFTMLSHASNGVAVDSYQNIYVVMVCGGGETFVASSRDGGKTYSEPVATGIVGPSDVAIVGGERGEVFVAGLTGTSLRYTWSTDAGASWETPIPLDKTLAEFDVDWFGVAMRYRAGKVYVAAKAQPCSESTHVFVADGASVSRTDTELATCPGDLLLDPDGTDMWLLGDVGAIEILRSQDGAGSFQPEVTEVATGGLLFDWATSSDALFYGGYGAPGSIFGRILHRDLSEVIPIAGGRTGLPAERAIDATRSGTLFSAVVEAEGRPVVLERVRPEAMAVDAQVRRFGEDTFTPELLALPHDLGAVIAYTELASGQEGVYVTVQTY